MYAWHGMGEGVVRRKKERRGYSNDTIRYRFTPLTGFTYLPYDFIYKGTC